MKARSISTLATMSRYAGPPWRALGSGRLVTSEMDVGVAAVLDLLIDREHDKIADVDVARPCQHVQHGIGDIL